MRAGRLGEGEGELLDGDLTALAPQLPCDLLEVLSDGRTRAAG